jgi:hypothetical protein
MHSVSIRGLLVLIAVALVAGCSANKGKIEGTKWTSEATTMKGQPIPAGALDLDFRSDGSLVYRAGLQTYTGTYTLGTADTVVLNLDQPIAGLKTHAEKISIDGERLTMTDSDGSKLTFVKAKPGNPQQK